MDPKVLDLASTYPWSQWIIVISAVLVVVTFMLSLILKTFKSIKVSLSELLPKKHSYSEQLLVENAVNEHLSYMRQETFADRVMVYRIHNGINDIANNPLLKVTCFNETLHRGIQSRMQTIQNTPISFFKTFTTSLAQGRYIALDDLNCEKQNVDSSLREFIRNSGAKSCYVFPLENPFGELFGFVILHYVRERRVLEPDRLKWLSNRASGLGALISTTRDT